jgi:PmbA protein
LEGGGNVIDICEYAVGKGETCGADEVEAVWMKEVTTTVEAELGEISNTSMTKNEGLRIRVIKDGAVSSVFTYSMDRTSVEKAVEKAVAAARVGQKDAYWDSLPSPGGYQRVSLWDQSMDVGADEMTEDVAEMLHMLPKGVTASFAVNEIELMYKACVNSNGIHHEDKSALGTYGMGVVGMLGDGVTPEFEKILYLRKYSPDPQSITESLVDSINRFSPLKPASSGKSTVILSPHALQDLFLFTLFRAVSGDNVVRGKSLLAGKEGQQVACPAVTLHDNGTIRKGTRSCEMDDEGVPCQDTAIIENGVLQGFIWNDYWAKRVGGSSTGNARYSIRSNAMSIQHTTMVFNPGDCTREELFDVRDGYYVVRVQGAHGANPESGDFSVVCAPAYKIRNGEIAGGCVGMMLSDNVYSLLEKVEAIGNECEVGWAAVLPPMRFSDVNVAAK